MSTIVPPSGAEQPHIALYCLTTSKQSGIFCAPMTDFETHPDRYVHWKLSTDGPVARLVMSVVEERPHRPGYRLKLNSYDLGVDIELFDAVQSLRF